MTNIATVFENVNGASFVGLDTVTKVALKGGKKNPMQGRVTKRTTGSQVMVFQNKKTNAYAAMVERRLTAEGKDPKSFTLGERAWGERIPETPFIRHVNKANEVCYYLEVIFLKSGKTEYFLDDAPIAKEDIEGLDPATVNEDSQGGLENKVVIRTIGVASVEAVRIDSTEYKGPFTFSM